VKKKSGQLLALGVDLGATKVEAALVDGSGKLMTSVRHFTHAEKGPAAVVEGIAESVKTCLATAGCRAAYLGIGVAAEVEGGTGNVISAANMKWRDVPLKKMLEKATGMPVFVTNDVRAAAWAEWKFGAGRGVDDLACAFVGTGLGGGIITHGRLLEGYGNAAAEVGHITIVAGGRKCTCGGRGCLEAYAGGWAIAQRAQEAVKAHKQAGGKLTALAGSIDKITAATVAQAYLAGDLLARRLVKSTARYLAAGMTGIIHVLNPQVFILGGGVIEGLPQYIEMVEPLVRSRALEASLRGLRIIRASLGNKAGVIGAAGMAGERRAGKGN